MKLLYIFHSLVLTSAAIDVRLDSTDQYCRGSNLASKNHKPNIEAPEMRATVRPVDQDVL